MARVLALVGAVVGAIISVLSIVALPWARYGDISIPLDRFPGWEVHVVSVLGLHACVAWTVFVSAKQRRAPLALGAVSSLVAAGSAIALAMRYDNATDFFSGVVPVVSPSLGPGPIVAMLAILVSIGSVAAIHLGTRGAGTPTAAAANGGSPSGHSSIK